MSRKREAKNFAFVGDEDGAAEEKRDFDIWGQTKGLLRARWEMWMKEGPPSRGGDRRKRQSSASGRSPGVAKSITRALGFSSISNV